MNKEITINIKNCSRCGENHNDLVFKALTIPFEAKDGGWTYWAKCPINGEPILMKIIE
jgi:hypothetical protein